jgi:histidinol-phosphate aminotransferase
MSLLARVRPDIAAFTPYASARRSGFDARVRLDANESPWDAADDGLAITRGLNRYPPPQPDALRRRLAALYGVDVGNIWVGRGSDEAIDLLLRAFCRAGVDNIVCVAPTFGMYRIGARLQGAACRTLELAPDDEFALDDARLLALVDADTKLVVLCSPNNPSGTLFHGERNERLARALAGRALLVVDEAYVEFAGVASAATLIERLPNLAVLRTLSKAHALAGARSGALVAAPEIVDLVGRIAAPYPLPSDSAHAAFAALEPAALERTRARIALTIAERERVATALVRGRGVLRVWRSAGNFVLVRFDDAAIRFRELLDAGILVRDFSAQPALAGCLRISIGRPDENDALLAALGAAA